MLRRKQLAEDLACNPEFREWVLNPNEENSVYWKDWAKSSPENYRMLKEAKTLVLAFSSNTDGQTFNQKDEDALWNRIENSAFGESNTVRSIENKKYNAIVVNEKPTDGFSRQIFGWAAIAALLVISVGIYFFFVNQNRPEEIAMVPEPVKQIYKEVPKGQKLKMFLPDGSKVVLNSLSSISYPSAFKDNLREVEVAGEVYFEVKRDSLRPFHVKAQNLVTEVLGTSFNVKAYPDAKDIKVSLLSGKVLVKSANGKNTISIDPGEEVKMNTETGLLTKDKVKYPNELQWMDGILAFNNESLARVFEKLELWYGVEFKIENMPRGKVVTGKFENEYLDNVLQSIQYTVSFDFKIDSDNVYVKF